MNYVALLLLEEARNSGARRHRRAPRCDIYTASSLEKANHMQL